VTTLTLNTPRWAEPLLKPARYKGARGGRGSGKSHFFAELLIEDILIDANLMAVSIRETQKSLKYSSKLLIEQKIQTLGVSSSFKITREEIKRVGGDGLIIFQGMQDHTADSIKSLEGFKRAWIEEAQSISERSLRLLRPTIRADNSEIWAAWNPEFEDDPIELLFKNIDDNMILVDVNYHQNPFFNNVSEDERQRDLRILSPQMYEHIWEGAYITGDMGAVFKWEWFGLHEYVAPFNGFERIIHSWDTAYKANEHNDPSACTVWGLKDNHAYLLDCVNERLEYPELKKRIAELCVLHPPHTVLIEDKASGQSLIQELFSVPNLSTAVSGSPIVAINPLGDKVTRAVACCDVIAAGKISVPKNNTPWLTDYKKQLVRFSYDKELLKKQHDDMVDSTSQFINWWQNKKRYYINGVWIDG
jgi:PBSX family phage terminase large subunit